jgi:hypothetical protein
MSWSVRYDLFNHINGNTDLKVSLALAYLVDTGFALRYEHGAKVSLHGNEKGHQGEHKDWIIAEWIDR